MTLLCWKSRWFVLCLVLVCLYAIPSSATTVVMLSDTDLTVDSRVIVTGRVASMISAWDDRGSMAWTYVEVATDRVLKGQSESTIVLKQMGGTVGESGVFVSGQARFVIGERVLLYLNTLPDGTLHAAHGFMGKFSIVTDQTGREYVERSVDAREVEFLSQSTGSDVTNQAPLDSYVQKIQETLNREASRIADIEAARSGQPLVAVPKEYARKKRESRGFAPDFVLFGGGVRWMEADAGQPISFNLNPNSSPIAGGGSAEITRAMNAWAAQSGAAIRLRVAGQTASCGISMDGSNTISFGDCLNQLDQPIGCAGVAALTSFSWTREFKVIGGTTFSRLLETDTVFNNGMECFLGNSANLAEVACHELGHCIGLDHSPDASAIMWPQAHGHGRDATLGADDKAGALAIYPASSSGGPGPTPGPVSITSLSITDGIQNRFYNATLQASGGTPPYRWGFAGGALPSGLNLAPNGTIEGTPRTTGSFSFAVQVFDSASPAQIDARWLSMTIRDAATSTGVPVINRVKLKGSKKLRVYGVNFVSNSLLLINGVLFEPDSFELDGSSEVLFLKARLNVGAEGTNVLIVINSDSRSAPFFF
jgi:hypothetical protein